MKIKRLASWVFPSFVGTLVSSWAYVTLATLFGFVWPIPGSKLLSWLLLMLIATPVAGALACVTMAFDVLLVAVKARDLPQGASAWRMAAVSSLIVGASYVFFRPSIVGGLGGLFLTLVAPVVVSSLGVRLAMGQRIDASRKR
jgi:hypothetical protein